jgi:hypothetical protein
MQEAEAGEQEVAGQPGTAQQIKINKKLKQPDASGSRL